MLTILVVHAQTRFKKDTKQFLNSKGIVQETFSPHQIVGLSLSMEQNNSNTMQLRTNLFERK